VRAVERATGALTLTNPISHKAGKLTQYLAGPTELKLLHMVTADPARTPTFVLFARPDYYVTGGCGYAYNSAPSDTSLCVTQSRSYAWLHGNVQPDISTTWLGLAGPGVQHNGVDSSTWSDHTDIRPTMLALLEASELSIQGHNPPHFALSDEVAHHVIVVIPPF